MRTALLAAAFLSALSVAPALAQEPNPARLTLTGRGIAKMTPDIATISLGIVTQRKQASEALAQNSKDLTEALNAIKAAGIEAKDLQTANFSIQPQYNTYAANVPPRINGYEVRNTLIVTVRDLAKIGALLDKVVVLGVNSVQGPDFGTSKPEEALDNARRDAMKDVKKNADMYAQGLGLKLGRIVQVNENYSSPAPQPKLMMRAAAESAPASVPIEGGEVETSMQISATWELLP